MFHENIAVKQAYVYMYIPDTTVCIMDTNYIGHILSILLPNLNGSSSRFLSLVSSTPTDIYGYKANLRYFLL